MHYQPLESEKFFLQEMHQRELAWKRYRSQKAIRDFITFLFGAGVILGTLRFIHSSPEIVSEFGRWFGL